MHLCLMQSFCATQLHRLALIINGRNNGSDLGGYLLRHNRIDSVQLTINRIWTLNIAAHDNPRILRLIASGRMVAVFIGAVS